MFRSRPYFRCYVGLFEGFLVITRNYTAISTPHNGSDSLFNQPKHASYTKNGFRLIFVCWIHFGYSRNPKNVIFFIIDIFEIFKFWFLGKFEFFQNCYFMHLYSMLGYQQTYFGQKLGNRYFQTPYWSQKRPRLNSF